MARLRTPDDEQRDEVEPLKLRRACKLMRANLTPEMERRLARECGLPVAELRARANEGTT
jgi:hypothetical protein